MTILNWSEILLPREQMVDELCLKFKNISREYKQRGEHSPIEFVEGRVKKITSIIEKANKKCIPYENIEEEVWDIAGIRIVCKFVEDIDKVVKVIRDREGKDLSIVAERDYITDTKVSGYRSYHLIIKYSVITITGVKEIFGEIQIRTIAMNFWATVEHSLRYKYSGNMAPELKRRLEISAEAAFNLDKEMSKIRHEVVEAQKVVEEKNDLVTDILKNIQNLFFIAKVEEAKELNKKFFELYEKSDIISLKSFNEELIALTKRYDVHYI